MGFAEQLSEVLSRLPDNRQTLLFSATLPKRLVEFASAGLSEPVLVRLDVESKISEQLKVIIKKKMNKKKNHILAESNKYDGCSRSRTCKCSQLGSGLLFGNILTEMPTVPFLQYLVLFSSCKYLWFWAKCLKIPFFFFFKDHFVYTSMETKWKILFFKPKYFFSSSKILFSFIRGWHLCIHIIQWQVGQKCL